MIDEQKTLALFGYKSTELSKGSHKRIVRKCDVCNKIDEIMYFSKFFDICEACAAKNRIKKYGHPRYGSHLSIKTKIKQSCSRRKIDIDKFSGFASSLKEIFIRSFEYKKWRMSVFERDNFFCMECHRRGGNLAVHHILPYRDWQDSQYSLNIMNGITLCRDCHQKTFGREYEFANKYFDIVNEGKLLCSA